MRYRNRIKLAPGLNINLSKSGISSTVGPRGANINVGKDGAYLNTGIPGTGLYDRKKISGSKRKTSSPSGKSSDKRVGVQLDLNEVYEPVIQIFDENGRNITNDNLINKIKRTTEYKENLKTIYKKYLGKIQEETYEFTELHKRIVIPVKEEDIRKELDKLKPKVYSKKKFQQKEPTREDVEEELSKEANQKFQSILFWKNKKNRQAFIAENLSNKYMIIWESWKNEKTLFKSTESEKEREQNAEFQKDYEIKKKLLKGNLEGTSEAVLMNFETILNEIKVRPEFSLDFEYDEKHKHFHIDLDLPEIEHLPKETGIILKSGKLSVKSKTQKILNEEYAYCITGLALLIGGVAFMSGVGVEKVTIAGYSQRTDKKDGIEKDDYLFSVEFDREKFSSINFEKIEPLETFKLFPHKISISKTFEFTPIDLS